MDIEKIFHDFCRDNDLDIQLSCTMPGGYEEAYGTFDITNKTLFYNDGMLGKSDDCEKLFYLFHELRHALQYVYPDSFDPLLRKSLAYVIMYNGVCYKLCGDEWKECVLDGGEEMFTDIYLSQPYERDANRFAYEKTTSMLGRSKQLDDLYMWSVPGRNVSDECMYDIYARIDEAINETI